MSTQNQNGYLLLYRSNEWYKALSSEELCCWMSKRSKKPVNWRGKHNS